MRNLVLSLQNSRVKKAQFVNMFSNKFNVRWINGTIEGHRHICDGTFPECNK